MYLRRNHQSTNLKVHICASFVDRLLGKHLSHLSPVLVFHTRFGIHTFFLRHPIDVLVLDSTNMVVSLTSSLPPNSIYLYPPNYQVVVEVPQGTISKHRIRVGDIIDW
jgi:uncharacterized protein